MLLEWAGAPASVTKWQYRLRGPIWQGAGGETWSEWRDIPGSDASTRSYRLGGLAQFRAYFFQVRGWPAVAEGNTSNAAPATTLRFEGDGIPHMMPAQVVEGGATYRIGGMDYVTTVPWNMRLMMGGGTLNSDGSITASLFDVATGSYLLIDVETGEYVERTITEEGAPGNEDVHARFDQIVASTRKLPRAVEMPAFEPVGEGTYYVSRDGVNFVVFDIPEGIAIEWDTIGSDSSGTVWFALRHVESGSYISVDADTAEYRGREIISDPDGGPGSLDASEIAALFAQIIESLRLE